MARVRERDMYCCITGQEVVADDFTGFEAAHIFPLSETDIVSFVTRSTLRCADSPLKVER